MTPLFTATRLVLGLTVVAFAALLQTIILLALLPSRSARIRSCIVIERIVGYSCTWLSGCHPTVHGREHLDGKRPAIYVVNHTSISDLFIVLSLIPSTTVGVAKKEIVCYPFFGQVYLLSGHLRIDRSNREAAAASMRALGKLVHEYNLSVVMSPEGTRSRDGRLQPFKKGLVHLAMQTGLPIVPMVIHGAHRAWRPDSLAIRPQQVRVDILPAVSTTHWSSKSTDDAVDEIHAIYRRELQQSDIELYDEGQHT